MDNGGFPDLSGVIGGLLSNPEALQGVIGAVAGLKNAGLFQGISPFSPDGGEEAQAPLQSEARSEEREPPKAPSGLSPSERTAGAYQGQSDAYTEPKEQSTAKSNAAPAFAFDEGAFSGSRGQRGRSDEFALPSLFPPRRERDRRRDLLLALRPYLCSERQERLDGILKILGLLEMAKHLGLGFGGTQEGSKCCTAENSGWICPQATEAWR